MEAIQERILFLLSEGAKSWSELKKQLKISDRTLSKHIKKLLASGKITEEIDKKDRRKKRYRLVVKPDICESIVSYTVALKMLGEFYPWREANDIIEFDKEKFEKYCLNIGKLVIFSSILDDVFSDIAEEVIKELKTSIHDNLLYDEYTVESLHAIKNEAFKGLIDMLKKGELDLSKIESFVIRVLISRYNEIDNSLLAAIDARIPYNFKKHYEDISCHMSYRMSLLKILDDYISKIIEDHCNGKVSSNNKLSSTNHKSL